jgi:hypothetical protein
LIANDFQIPSETLLPTTFAIAAGASPDQEAIIRLSALLGGTPVIKPDTGAWRTYSRISRSSTLSSATRTVA